MPTTSHVTPQSGATTSLSTGFNSAEDGHGPDHWDVGCTDSGFALPWFPMTKRETKVLGVAYTKKRPNANLRKNRPLSLFSPSIF